MSLSRCDFIKRSTLAASAPAAASSAAHINPIIGTSMPVTLRLAPGQAFEERRQ